MDDIFYDELYKILQQFHDKNDIIYGNVFFCEKENISKLIESDVLKEKIISWLMPT